MRIFKKNLVNLKKNFKSFRNEDGMSTLAGIFSVSILVMFALGSLSSMVILQTKMVADQSSSAKSLNKSDAAEAIFENDFYTNGVPLNSSYNDPNGAFSYQVYVSTSSNQPTSLTSAGATVWNGGTFANNVRWVILKKTIGDKESITIYKYLKKNSLYQTDVISNRDGAIVIAGSTIDVAPGVTAPTRILNNAYTAGITTSSAGANTINASNSEINVGLERFDNSVNATSLTGLITSNLNVRGDILTYGRIADSGNTKVYGDICSTSSIAATIQSMGGGKRLTNTTNCSESIEGGVSNRQNAPSYAQWADNANNGYNEDMMSSYALTAAECANFATLKSRLEGFTSNTFVDASICNGNIAAFNTSTEKVLNLKSSVTLSAHGWTTGTLNIKNLIINSTGTKDISFNIYSRMPITIGSTTINGIFYKNGVKGNIMSASKITLYKSEVVGAIATTYDETADSNNPRAGAISINSSKIYYYPVINYFQAYNYQGGIRNVNTFAQLIKVSS